VNDASSRSTAGLQSRRTNKRPANSGLVAKNQEISIYVRMRGGLGRTRTSNQVVMSELAALSLLAADQV
jgi:hypothetical protein